MRLHHVQVSCPRGGEGEARRFYADALGMTEVAKPTTLAGRGGCWFRSYDGPRVTAEIHVGVEDPFQPATKAHPALVVDDLDGILGRLDADGFEVDLTEERTFPGYRRAHVRDPHGNRVELLADPAGGQGP